MTVSRDAAIWAYRLILGREPENDEVVEWAMQAGNISELRQNFMQSPEFQQTLQAAAPRVGRLLEVDKVEIDLRSTPEQLQSMFDRIGQAWRAFGETEAHWSVLVDDQYRSQSIHQNIDRFYDTGTEDVEVFMNFLKRNDLPVRFERVLDFGCGVGRLTLALSRYADRVDGVDISPPHLALAEARAKEKGFGGVAFHAIGSVEALDAFRDYDLVISRIVLQHNPPPIMAALYAKLLAMLKPGGAALVQMPTHIRGQVFSTDAYLRSEQPQMEMNGLPQKAIFEIIAQAQCEVIEVREDGAAGFDEALSHTFLVRKR